MADVSIPGLPTIAPVTGDSLPLERAATSLLDRRVTVDALKTFAQAGLATVATTGAYADVTGKPTLSAVAISGAYSDVIGTPVLASVATVGTYASLTAKPALATVAGTGAYSDLISKPTLATVATSGLYADLTGKPALGTASAINLPGGTTTFMRGDGSFGAAGGGGFSSYTWATKPSASVAGAGTEIDITDIGPRRSRWYSDGTNWRPVNGMVVLKQFGGSLASPGASYTGAIANAQIVQPGGNLKFPAGMLLPGAIISIGSIERYVTVGSTNIVRQFRIGNTGTLTNDYTVQPFSFQAGWSVVSDFRISVASSTVLTTTGGTAPNGTQYNSTSDISGARIDTTVDMYLTIETYLNAVADIYQMVSLTVSLYQ